jgi:uncharacterized protein YjbI with pentapeptide repeats
MPIRSLTGLSVGTVAALLWASALKAAADLTDALLYEADLANAIPTDAQIEGAKFAAAIMPDGKRAE